MTFSVFYGASCADAPPLTPFTVSIAPTAWYQSIYGPTDLNTNFTATASAGTSPTYSWQWLPQITYLSTVTLTNATSATCNLRIQATDAYFDCAGTLRCTITNSLGSAIGNALISVLDDID